MYEDWSDDHIAYLVGWLAFESWDFGGSSPGVDVSSFLKCDVFPHEYPFDTWPAEKQMRIARAAFAALSHRGLADFYEGYAFSTPGKDRWSRAEVEAWNREHPISPEQIDAVLEREMPDWWLGERVHNVEFVLTDEAEALCIWWRDHHPSTVADYVKNPYPNWKVG